MPNYRQIKAPKAEVLRTMAETDQCIKEKIQEAKIQRKIHDNKVKDYLVHNGMLDFLNIDWTHLHRRI